MMIFQTLLVRNHESLAVLYVHRIYLYTIHIQANIVLNLNITLNNKILIEYRIYPFERNL